MILEIVLLAGFFHHKNKIDPAKQQFEDNKAYLTRAENGLRAYVSDTKYYGFERDEIKLFAHQLYMCEQPMSPAELDVCTDVLSEVGQSLDAKDKVLHRENVI